MVGRGFYFFGVFLLISDGFVVLMSLWGLSLCIFSPEVALNMARGASKMNYPDLKPFLIFIFWTFVIYVPKVISAIAILRLIEWGRKFILTINCLLTLRLLFRVGNIALMRRPANLLTTGISLVIYGSVIYFFTRSKVKEQFK